MSIEQDIQKALANEPKVKSRRGRPRKGAVSMEKLTTVKIREPLYSSLDRLSRRQGRDISDLVREAILNYLSKYMSLEELMGQTEEKTQE